MTATDGAYDPDRGRTTRLIILLGHHSLVIQPLMYALTWVTIVATWWMKKGPAESVVSWTGVGLITIGLVSLAARSAHDRTLCLLDITQSPLLDPQAAVDRNRKHLAFMHNRARRGMVLLAGGLPLAVLLVVPPRLLDSNLSKMAATVCAALGLAAMSYEAHADRIHRRLHPWCPWCDHRGDGETPVKTPTPDPAGVA